MDNEALSRQLRQPHGREAVDLGEQMSRNNAATNRRCIAAMALQAGNRVLEIGPGNAAFAGEMVSAAAHVRYLGVDWSEAMVAQARARYRDSAESDRIALLRGSSETLPFPDASFERVLAVHTLYFWQPAERHLQEIRRVLRPGGLLCLAFGDSHFMAQLPFTAHGFHLYDRQAAEALLASSGLAVQACDEHRETGTSNAGALVDKRVHILLATPDSSSM
ncbi:class I SAM-dependent methyltransferase [Algiphilus aromaticivorans]|uniref:class I SAM-dependent methyltransferase n=1 Tax=Algiphilus aromaticivorans TaxID=382454 RepID=UPI0005C17E50|nr:class I SAM-dependent methyltransferase [Algiphilus aromaticivorans]